MAKAPTIKLNDGREIPTIGLGTYALVLDLSENASQSLGMTPDSSQSSTRNASVNNECQNAVEAAIECGYRHIDTAAFYNNEDEVGAGINNAIKRGIVTREEIFLTTKLWNNRHDYDKVLPTLQESLKKLSLPYVDLYLIHWPIGVKEDGTYSDVDYLDTWKGFEKCHELGLAKSIGVSNFNESQLERLLNNCKIKPVVNQFEVNLNMNQKPLIKFCHEKGVAVTAYSPFGSMVGYRSGDFKYPPSIDDPILTAIGEKYKKSTTQVALRYLIDCGLIIIPKSVKPSRLVQNIDIFDFKLTPEELNQLDEFNKNYRMIAVPFWKDHKYYPF